MQSKFNYYTDSYMLSVHYRGTQFGMLIEYLNKEHPELCHDTDGTMQLLYNAFNCFDLMQCFCRKF
jgi:hypothetical protein